MKYILAVLNSRTAQFFFEKTFHSVKVLRSHLERIPIPMADAGTQREIIRLVEQMIETRSEGVNEKRKIIYDRIDRMVAKLYGLNEEMYRLME